MNIEELNKLEEKINLLVQSQKSLREENSRLKAEIEKHQQQSSLNAEEQNQIRQKVSTLIQLIDSIEE